jgi:hypothetical protein
MFHLPRSGLWYFAYCNFGNLFESLRFDYNVGINAMTANGFVMLANEYDASDPDPMTKAQFLTYRGAVESPPYRECAMTSLREDLHSLKTFKVRASAIPANSDITTFDVANFYLCTQGQSDATTTIGSLLVSYTVRLMAPQLSLSGSGTSLGGLYSGSSNAAPFATLSAGNNVPATRISTGTTTSITTWTFSQPWEGVVALTFTGTTLIDGVVSGTATSILQNVTTDTAQTESSALIFLTALPNQTLIWTQGNATIATSFAAFGQGDLV